MPSAEGYRIQSPAGDHSGPPRTWSSSTALVRGIGMALATGLILTNWSFPDANTTTAIHWLSGDQEWVRGETSPRLATTMARPPEELASRSRIFPAASRESKVNRVPSGAQRGTAMPTNSEPCEPSIIRRENPFGEMSWIMEPPDRSV